MAGLLVQHCSLQQRVLKDLRETRGGSTASICAFGRIPKEFLYGNCVKSLDQLDYHDTWESTADSRESWRFTVRSGVQKAETSKNNHTVNSKDLFQPQSAVLALTLLGLIRLFVELFCVTWTKTAPPNFVSASSKTDLDHSGSRFSTSLHYGPK